MVLPLDAFSTELLLKIFKYLDICDLCKLKQTCKRFNEIIEKWGHSLNKNVKPLVTNQAHPVVANRSVRLLSLFERLRISRNWRLGIYREKAVLYSRARYIPWLQLEKDLLWLSRGAYIQAYERNSKGLNTRNVNYVIKGNRPDVCHFVKKNNLILSGQMDGSIRLWSLDDQTFVFNLEDSHEADVNSVDMNDTIVVSGSRDNYVKIWNKPFGNTPTTCHQQIDLGDRVWAVALSEENKSLLAIGSAGITDFTTVTIFDMNNQTIVAKFDSEMLGAGVLDIKWESSSLLWSSGYDGFVRRWDMRTGKCEQGFGDPCGATIYCFQYDYYNSLITGTQSNGRVVLWDTRQSDYVQMYFMDCCRRRDKSSPVYSLSYDADCLFAATDQYVNILDFSIFRGTPKDYSNLFMSFSI